MKKDITQIARQLLKQNLALSEEEQLLIIYDESTLIIGESFFTAGIELGARSMLLRIQPLGKNGVEPPPVVARAMMEADVVIAATAHSLTHTQARKAACNAGARIATMPGITEDMFFSGPITADYDKVAFYTKKLKKLLDSAERAVITKEGYSLKMNLAGRQGNASTGLFWEKGSSGNLPSGEAYIAPLEGSAEGEVIIDGSLSGLGKLNTPLKFSFSQGYLVDIKGPDKEKLEKLLGDNKLARNLAELGIGTNDRARITGIILEDEKVYGTVHIALGSNDTFGGTVAAGIHLDGVILQPDLYLDNILVIRQGKLMLDK